MTSSTAGSLVLVGASAKTPWAYWLLRNLDLYGYPGEIWPISRSTDSFNGIPTFPDVSALPGEVDTAVVMLPAKPAVDTAEELLARGARTLVVVSNGFQESGTEEGRALQARLVEACARAGARLIGPNCVGYASYHDRICAIAEPVPADTPPGGVTVISQSGALLSGVLASLQLRGLGIDEAYSLGNGAQFGLAESIARAAERPSTTMVCAVVEGVGDPHGVEAGLRAARERGKPVIILRLGSSDGAKGLAASHTGAVVGETRLLDEWLTSRGAIVTDEIEEFSEVAGLAMRLSQREGGAFVVTGSGGAAGLAADFAARYGLRLARISDETATTIRDHLGATALVSNPLDMVGGAPQAREAIYRAIAADPDVAVIVEPVAVMWPDDSEGRVWHRANTELLARTAAERGVLTIFASTFQQEPSEFVRRVAGQQDGVVVSGSLELTVRALARLLTDSRPGSATAGSTGHAIGEAEGRRLLEQLELPIAVGVEAEGVDAVLTAAARLAPPWVLKTAAPGVMHKGTVGGVRVGLRTLQELREACVRMETAVGEVHPDHAGRFLLQEMAQGPELLVTLVRDPVAGPVLVMGVGGWAAELADPLLTCPLPTTDADLTNVIRASGVTRAIAGPASEAALVSLLQTLAGAFLPGGLLGDCSFVECNPVILTADGPRVVDVLLGGAIDLPKGTT